MQIYNKEARKGAKTASKKAQKNTPEKTELRTAHSAQLKKGIGCQRARKVIIIYIIFINYKYNIYNNIIPNGYSWMLFYNCALCAVRNRTISRLQKNGGCFFEHGNHQQKQTHCVRIISNSRYFKTLCYIICAFPAKLVFSQK